MGGQIRKDDLILKKYRHLVGFNVWHTGAVVVFVRLQVKVGEHEFYRNWLLGIVNHFLHVLHWNEILPLGIIAVIQKKTASKKNIGARTHPIMGIQSMQLPIQIEANPINPGPILCVLEFPQYGHGDQSWLFVLIGAVAPQCGQAIASIETSFPHSRHGFNDIVLSLF